MRTALVHCQKYGVSSVAGVQKLTPWLARHAHPQQGHHVVVVVSARATQLRPVAMASSFPESGPRERTAAVRGLAHLDGAACACLRERVGDASAHRQPVRIIPPIATWIHGLSMSGHFVCRTSSRAQDCVDRRLPGVPQEGSPRRWDAAGAITPRGHGCGARLRVWRDLLRFDACIRPTRGSCPAHGASPLS